MTAALPSNLVIYFFSCSTSSAKSDCRKSRRCSHHGLSEVGMSIGDGRYIRFQMLEILHVGVNHVHAML
jgi:hypothetical protein